MTIKMFAMAASMLLASAGASATTTNWGVHGAAEIGTGFALGANTAIDDIYQFSLASLSDVQGVSVANDGANGVFNLVNGDVSLFQVGNNTAIGLFTFGATSVSYDFGSLAAGNYYYEVKAAVGPAAQAGSYLLSSTLAADPVPEPESYALLIAGLCAVSVAVRRRRG